MFDKVILGEAEIRLIYKKKQYKYNESFRCVSGFLVLNDLEMFRIRRLRPSASLVN